MIRSLEIKERTDARGKTGISAADAEDILRMMKRRQS